MPSAQSDVHETAFAGDSDARFEWSDDWKSRQLKKVKIVAPALGGMVKLFDSRGACDTVSETLLYFGTSDLGLSDGYNFYTYKGFMNLFSIDKNNNDPYLLRTSVENARMRYEAVEDIQKSYSELISLLDRAKISRSKIEMINIPMTPEGPDMELVRQYVESDPAVKGIWCVPKYSNPQGYTYSADTVRAFAALKPAADDFRIFWDNAYIVHGFRDEDDELLNIFDACKEYGSEDMVYEYMSTSKVTFSGAGVAVLAASANNVKFLLKQMGVQTIGYDKINQIRHVHYLKDVEGVKAHMKKQADYLRPKFDYVLTALDKGLSEYGIGAWTNPNGGYFISFDGLPGTAKRCVGLCADAGVKFTGAGATFPYGKDPEDKNIRIAPSFPSISDLHGSMEVFCLCQRIAALETLIAQ